MVVNACDKNGLINSLVSARYPDRVIRPFFVLRETYSNGIYAEQQCISHVVHLHTNYGEHAMKILLVSAAAAVAAAAIFTPRRRAPKL